MSLASHHYADVALERSMHDSDAIARLEGVIERKGRTRFLKCSQLAQFPAKKRLIRDLENPDDQVAAEGFLPVRARAAKENVPGKKRQVGSQGPSCPPNPLLTLGNVERDFEREEEAGERLLLATPGVRDPPGSLHLREVEEVRVRDLHFVLQKRHGGLSLSARRARGLPSDMQM